MNFSKLDVFIRASILAFFVGAVALVYAGPKPSYIAQGTLRTTDLVVDNTATADGGKRIFDDPGTALARDGVSPNKLNLNITLTTCGVGQAEVSTAADGTSSCATFTPGGAISGTPNTIAMFTPDGSHVGDSLITQSGTTDTVGGTFGVNTSGQSITFGTFFGANSDGFNVWIGGGGLSSIGSIGDTTLGSRNVSVGKDALLVDTTGEAAVAIGSRALRANTTGINNVAIGADALLANVSSDDSVAVGWGALAANTVSGNNALGFKALFTNSTGTGNNAFGFAALLLNQSGINNSAFGYDALLSNVDGNNNTAIGIETLWLNTHGSANTAIGFLASSANTTGSDNIAVGPNALIANTTGIRNIALGSSALADLLIVDSTGNNVAIGYNTGRGIVTGIKNTIIGANVTGLAAGLSNQIIIADGDGNKRIQVNSSGNTTLGGTVTVTDALTVTSSTISSALNLTNTAAGGKQWQIRSVSPGGDLFVTNLTDSVAVMDLGVAGAITVYHALSALSTLVVSGKTTLATVSSAGTVPVVTVCTGTGFAQTGGAWKGKITAATATTSCVLTFASNLVSCTVSDETLLVTYSISGAALTVNNAALGATNIHYDCAI